MFWVHKIVGSSPAALSVGIASMVELVDTVDSKSIEIFLV